MKERPILFSGDMVRAILDGRKTQTRRPMPQPMPNTVGFAEKGVNWKSGKTFWMPHDGVSQADKLIEHPFGKPGDRLWVKETHFCYGKWIQNGFNKKGKAKLSFKLFTTETRYVDNPPSEVEKGRSQNLGWYKRPSIFMPRWASRITLEVMKVRVERVQEISAADAREEGVGVISCHHPEWDGDPDEYRKLFRLLWGSLYGEGAFAANGWVWVGEFRRVEETPR